jgi:hypothetical protein
MRTAVTCVVLTAAIATPGLVVAAMSSGGHGVTLFAGTTLTATAQAVPVRLPPIDPALRPAVHAVKQAFAAEGIRLAVSSGRLGEADAFQLSGLGRCPIFIVIQLARLSTNTLFGSSCGTGTVKVGRMTIRYTPPSAGPTIRQAVAGLPR